MTSVVAGEHLQTRWFLARCCTGREGTFRLKGSVPQACCPWGSQPLVLGSFRPIGLK